MVVVFIFFEKVHKKTSHLKRWLVFKDFMERLE